jgi:hypothetical protein
MSEHAGKKDTSATRVRNAIRRSYDAKCKVTAINYAEKTNNCSAARKFGVAEANLRRRREQKEKLRNAKCIRKSFRGPKHGFQELEEEVVEFVRLKRKIEVQITRETIKYKARELCKPHITKNHLKASAGWCVRMTRRNGFSLWRRTSLCQRVPAGFEEKLVAFQRHVIGLRQKHSYLLSQIGNADETPVYFDMPPNYTVDDTGAKSVAVKTSGHEKMRATVMLVVLADGNKLPLYVFLNRKNMPKEQLPRGIIVRCQPVGWMTSDLMKDWSLVVVGNRRPGTLLRKEMLILDAFKGHLTPEVKATITGGSINTDLVVIPSGMTSQLKVLDVVVNKPFKDHLKQWLLSGDHAFNPAGRIEKPRVTNLCQWILMIWQRISPEVYVKGYQKCCISNAMDGSDDGLWNVSAEDGNVRRDGEEEEVTECEDRDSDTD